MKEGGGLENTLTCHFYAREGGGSKERVTMSFYIMFSMALLRDLKIETFSGMSNFFAAV